MRAASERKREIKSIERILTAHIDSPCVYIWHVESVTNDGIFNKKAAAAAAAAIMQHINVIKCYA